MRFARVFALGSAALVVTASAFATVIQPDGRIVPQDTKPSNGEAQLYDLFGDGGPQGTHGFAGGLRDPIDWRTNANAKPELFSPLCRFRATQVMKETGSNLSIGWYNALADGGRPADSDVHAVLGPESDAGSQVGATITGAIIRGNPAYQGGLVGFALMRGTTATPKYFFTQRSLNPICTSAAAGCVVDGGINGQGFVGPFAMALVYKSVRFANSYYLAFEDQAVSANGFGGNDGDYQDYVFLIEGINCSGAGAPCDVNGAQGVCKSGITDCDGTGNLSCKAIGAASAEVCDGLDNDCDGVVDDNAPCPTDFVCSRGRCVPRCGGGEFRCSNGFVCSAGLCVEASCETKSCPDGTVCVGGNCKAPCDGVVCPRGQVCRGGGCSDPCLGVACGDGLVCEGGACVTSCQCSAEACGAGRVCDGSDAGASAGHCVDNGCVGKTCATGEVCAAGACVSACSGAVCPVGQACANGVCAPLPPSDGGDGSGLSSGSAGLTPPAGSPGTAGNAGSPGNGAAFDGGDSSGCGCRAAPLRVRDAIGLGMLGAALAWLSRRRRSK